MRVGLANSCGGEDSGWDEGHSGSKVLWGKNREEEGRKEGGKDERNGEREIERGKREREESIREGRREGEENTRRVSRKKNGEHEVRASCWRGGMETQDGRVRMVEAGWERRGGRGGTGEAGMEVTSCSQWLMSRGYKGHAGRLCRGPHGTEEQGSVAHLSPPLPPFVALSSPFRSLSLPPPWSVS
ncbi:hypothetical protein E2C01_065408 [Portunus trituberculatus]|uniref:Uncharacterized protein n=1 Tax=Portunus trituberculatus TaxID=210409 RepID=A0A5B7HR10_PORTR|nr:hypothetical protein [Portunus trituberculatus]